MTLYKPALYDETDPFYAPLAFTVKGKWRYWRPSRAAVAAGHAPGTVRLTGQLGDGQDALRASEARELTRQMIVAITPEENPHRPNTFAWLIYRYRNDEQSPIHRQKANTRMSELWITDKWLAAIGPMLIEEMDYGQIWGTHKAMLTKKRSLSYISRLFSGLRRLAKYASILKAPGARDLRETLSDMRFQSPPKRTVAPTRDHVRAIIDKADELGLFAFGTGILLQWTFSLRAVDVRGHWLPAQEGEGGIQRTKRGGFNGRTRWQDGLTWDMVQPDLSGFWKVPSKTSKSMPEPVWFDMTEIPELQARLRLLANRDRIGPVIVSEKRDTPYTLSGWSHAFSRCREAAGVPANIWMMDTRSGALSEAAAMGADPIAIRDMAGHANLATTDRYLRNRAANTAKVITLRNAR